MPSLYGVETELNASHTADRQAIEIQRITYLKHRHSIHSRRLVDIVSIRTLTRAEVQPFIREVTRRLLVEDPTGAEGTLLLPLDGASLAVTRVEAAELVGRLMLALV
jgi:hypothetical protein